MNFFIELAKLQEQKNSYLCVGIDPDKGKIPEYFKNNNTLFDWCTGIVDTTIEFTAVYKPNTAFFAEEGYEGVLIQLIAYIQQKGALVILDSKRGDIGNTANKYAAEAFDRYCADAVTVSPYMGLDTVQPFLDREGKGVILLCRTSNPGGSDFQDLKLANGKVLYEHMAEVFKNWNTAVGGNRIGLVVGATHPVELAVIRGIIGNMPLLIPGIGAQHGNVKSTVQAGQTSQGGGLIINLSRGIIYDEDPGGAARKMRDSINQYIRLPEKVV